MSKTRTLAPAVLVTLVTLAAYASTLGHRLVWDDEWLTTRNPFLAGPRGWLHLVTSDLWTASGMEERSRFWRPLGSLSFAVNRLAANSALSYHAGNVVIHAAVVVALFALVARSGTVGRWGAAAVALLFGLAPLASEPVAWVAGRFDSLAALFAVIALVAQQRRRNTVGVTLACAAALACKESMIVLPVMVVAHEWLVLRRRVDLRKVLGLAACVALYLVARRLIGVPSRVLVAGLHADDLVSAFVFTLATLMPLLVAARGFDPWHVYHEPSAAAVIAVLAVVAALLIASLANVRRFPASPAARLAAFGLVWALAFVVLPSFAAPTLQMIGDRYAYVSLIGVALVVAAALDVARRRVPVGATAAVFVLSAVEVAATERRLRDWRDIQTLCDASLANDPDDFTALTLRGGELARRGDFAAAERDYARVRDRGVATRRALIGLCYVHVRQGRDVEAIDECRAALQQDERDPRAWLNLASALVNARRPREALEAADHALALKGHYAEAHFVRGIALAQLGLPAEAREEMLRTLEIAPRHAGAQSVLRQLGGAR